MNYYVIIKREYYVTLARSVRAGKPPWQFPSESFHDLLLFIIFCVVFLFGLGIYNNVWKPQECCSNAHPVCATSNKPYTEFLLQGIFMTTW